MATSVTQYGITWTFSTSLTTGQYANGDWYVVAPSGVTITDIYPTSVVGTGVANQIGNGATYGVGRTVNGSMTNPLAGTVNQGFDSYSTTFSASYNAARPGGNTLDVGNPLVLSAGTSIISTNSDPAAPGGNRATSLDAAILTVVASAPSSGTFRPQYCGTTKGSWNKSSLSYAVLNLLAPVSGTPTLATCSAYLARPWIEIDTTYQGREIHPVNNQPDYGREMAYELSDCLLRLQLNDSNASKEELFIRVVQYGIDVYGAVTNGGNWYSAGGHNMGRKMPMLLAGLALNDSAILAYADAAIHNNFCEDQHYFTVAAADVARTINHADYADKYRTDYTIRTAAVTISNASPAVVTWPTTTSTVTITNASPCVVTWNSHGFYHTQMVRFTTTGALPTGITAGTVYYVRAVDANSFKLDTVANGWDGSIYNNAPVNTSSAGSGVHTAYKGHGLGATQQIVFSTTGALPTGFTAGVKYWTRWTGLTVDQFTLSAAPSNEDSGAWGPVSDQAAINTSSAGSGTHTALFDMTGQADWGEQHLVDYSRDGSNWNSAYRRIVDGPLYGHVLAARLTTGAMAAWNWAPIFTYKDNPYDGGNTFANNMYAAYRNASDIVPPVINSFVIQTSGTAVTITFNELCQIGAGGNGGITLSLSGGAITATYSSGTGGNAFIYTLSGRVVNYGETGTYSYTQPTNGIEDIAGNDLVTVSTVAVTNSSTVNAPQPPPGSNRSHRYSRGRCGYRC